MPRALVILIILGGLLSCFMLALFLLSFYRGFKASCDWMDVNAGASGILVYADRDIISGVPIVEDDLVERKIDPEYVPTCSILCRDLIVGKTTRNFVGRRSEMSTLDFDISVGVEKEQYKLLRKREAENDPLCKHPVVSGLLKKKERSVSASRDIAQGEIIEDNFLVYIPVEGTILENSICDKWQAANRICRSAIEKGQLITESDFENSMNVGVVLYKAKENLEVDHLMEKDDLVAEEVKAKFCPDSAILDADYIVGHKVFQPIGKGNIIKAGYLN